MNKDEYIKLWVRKAGGDLKVAKRELGAEDSVLEAVCFHLQQAVEKYLKAFLAKFSEKIKRTHNLEFLIEQCIQLDGDFTQYEEKFDVIAGCGVEIRYPDTFLVLDEDELGVVLVIVEEFREFVLKKIGINPGEVG
ncbi:MAG: HEPN domain-containing protein [Candidatus Aminicenantes bacterium]|nr:HEPN domain-containing protein [Candidatus Aminicenantes bacterium]